MSIIVKMKHVRQSRQCSDGARKFCIRHGLDWADFLKNGIDAEKLIATGDAMALEVVRVARGRQ